MRDLYIVTYAGRTCGCFLAVLITYWLKNCTHSIEFNQYADAHGAEEIFVNNWKITSSDNPHNYEQILDAIEPLHKDSPFVVRQHFPLDHQSTLKKYNNFLNFVIEYDIDDFMILTGFDFTKRIIKHYDMNYKDPMTEDWLQHKETINLNPHEINDQQRKKYSIYFAYKTVDIKTNHYFSTGYKKESKNTVRVKFHDLLFQKDKFLKQISNAIEYPITDPVIQLYDSYVDANKKLITTQYPWIEWKD